MVSGSKTEMTLIVVLLVGLVGLSVVASDCDYTKHHEASTKTGDAEITPLKNKRLLDLFSDKAVSDSAFRSKCLSSK